MSFLSKLQSLFGRTPKPSSEQAEAIVEQLIDLGFLKFVSESEKADVRCQLLDSVTNNYVDSEWNDECVSADKRSYAADGEDLAEGDVGRCILQMKDVLLQEGVRLESVEDDFGEERYRVLVDGTPHLVYEVSGELDQDTWIQSHKRLIEIVNSLLEGAGSNEQLFGIYCGGNDGRVILLTLEMHDLLRANSSIFDERWMPLPATEIETH